MRQISITKRLLKQFGIEYLRLPDVNISNPYKVKSDYILIVAWMATMANNPDGEMTKILSAAFNGWMLGRDEFVLMEEEQPAFERIMMELYKEGMPDGTFKKS